MAPTNLDVAAIEQACVDVVSSIIDDYRPQLLEAALHGDRRERPNARHKDNFLSDFDMALHDHYREQLASRLPGFVYLSEEAEPETVGANPELAILVDPLDTSELAVRGLHGYTHLLVYSIAEARPLVAVVGDFYHHIDLYLGALPTDGTAHAALRTRGGPIEPIAQHPAPHRQPSDRLLVTSYNMRPTERFVPLANQTRLMALLANGLNEPGATTGPTGDHSRIGVDFGSIGCCHVATGATDAFIEITKGFALWDLLPGQLILEAAGGVVCDLTGEPLPWPTAAFTDIDTMQQAMSSRQRFIAAKTPDIAHAIAATIDP